MDSRSEQTITAAEIDSAYFIAPAPRPGQATEPSQPSMLELNSIFLILMTAVAAIFIAAAFLISTR